jgi:hAT family C-terminal dimerisation region/Domain of unknown function (DUF4413)
MSFGMHGESKEQVEQIQNDANTNLVSGLVKAKLTRKLRSKVWDDFEKYWSNSSVLLVIASIIDPRYKLKSIEFYFQEIYNIPGEAELNLKNMEMYLHKLLNEYVITNSTNQVESHRSSSSKDQNANFSTTKSSNRLHNNRRHDLAMYIQDSLTSEPIKSELDVYLEERNVLGLEDDNFDILAWWKSNAPKYPVLSSLVRDILGTLVSTVASESAFSTVGRILDDYRSSLSQSAVETLICTQDWLRAFAIGTNYYFYQNYTFRYIFLFL